jgi:hypothetical protein
VSQEQVPQSELLGFGLELLEYLRPDLEPSIGSLFRVAELLLEDFLGRDAVVVDKIDEFPALFRGEMSNPRPG